MFKYVVALSDHAVYSDATCERFTVIKPILEIAGPRSDAAHCAFAPGDSGPICEDGWPLGHAVTCEMIDVYQAQLDHGRTFLQAEKEWTGNPFVDDEDDYPFADA